MRRHASITPGPRRRREHGVMLHVVSRRSPPPPRWVRLYATVAATGAAGFALAQAVPPGLWRELVDVATVIAVFGSMAVWVRANRRALADGERRPRATGRPPVRRVVRSGDDDGDSPGLGAAPEASRDARAVLLGPGDDAALVYDFD